MPSRTNGRKPLGKLVARYTYTDADGELVYQVRRFQDDNDRKTFLQFHRNGSGWKAGRGDTPDLLYRLPEVVAAVERGDPIIITEGEKDADAARALGFNATTNSGGAGKWNDELSAYLRGANVTIIYDDDDDDGPGRKHARQVAASLKRVGARVRFARAKVGKDLSDHLAAGHSLKELVKGAPPSEAPEPEPDAADDALPLLYRAVRDALAEHARKHQLPLPETKTDGRRFEACCPAHDDRSPSLSVAIGDQRAVVLKCHAGCDPEAVVDALGGFDWSEFAAAGADATDDIDAEVEKLLQKREHEEQVNERLKQRELELIAKAHPADREAIIAVLTAYTKAVKLDDLPELISNDEIMSKPPVRWTVDGWFQEGDLTNVYSPAGSGKTLVEESLKEAISHGSPWNGWATNGGAVLVLSAEGVSMLQARIKAIRAVRQGADNERSRHTEEAWDITSVRGLARLVRAVREVGRQVGERVVAVLVDPADEYSPERGPEGVEHTKALALALRSLARGLGLGVVLFHHTNADGDRARGTEHLRMDAAGHVRLDRINDDVIGLVQEKQRNGVERAMKLDIVPTPPSVTLNAAEGRGGDGDYLKTDYIADKETAKAEKRERLKMDAARDPELRAAIMKLMPASEEEARERKWSKNKATNSPEVVAVCSSKGTLAAALDGLASDGFVKLAPVPGDKRNTILCWKVRDLPDLPKSKVEFG